MGAIARFAAGRRTKWVVIAAWVLAAIIAIPFQSKLQALASDESNAFKDRNAESTKVDQTIDARFPGGSETTAEILYTVDDQNKIANDGKALCSAHRIPDLVRVATAVQLGCGSAPKITYQQSSPIKDTSPDGKTHLTTVWTKDDATETVVRDVGTIRDTVGHHGVYVTGEAGFSADQSLALEGIDETLLIVTLILVLALLLLIYRSPVVAFVPLLVVGLPYIVAAGIVYAFAKAGAYRATGQATAMLIVLMFGAGTDYCLLLLPRYKEEIAAGTPQPMVVALQRTGPAIVSAGGIVVVVMLVLSLADYNATRWMGPVLALGTATTVLAGITLLPAILSALPTRSFRADKPSRLWPRIGELVRRRHAVLATAVIVFLALGALGNLKDNGTLDFAQQFRDPPESVTGLRHLQETFPPGQAGPVDIVTDSRTISDTLPKLGSDVAFSTDLVGFSNDQKLALVRVALDQDPFAERATDTIPQLRAKAKALDPHAMVGGPTAEILDTQNVLKADGKKIVPIALIAVFVIVAILLRSVIAPIYVIATVIASYAFALGVSALLFKESDPAQPLFAFIFLVALGVDYNVFLLTRIREEGDVIRGLERTGGVITSAGLILAGTFLTLLATKLESLFQVGFTVSLGLLVDTFLIRIFLVPSIALLLRSRAL